MDFIIIIIMNIFLCVWTICVNKLTPPTDLLVVALPCASNGMRISNLNANQIVRLVHGNDRFRTNETVLEEPVGAVAVSLLHTQNPEETDDYLAARVYHRVKGSQCL